METCSGSNRSSVVDEEVKFFLSVCERSAGDIETVVKRGNLLNERQCQELSSKIFQALGNIRWIKGFERGSTFAPFLPILYRSLEKAKLLVRECAEEDWTAVAVFQGQNESAFEEILLDVRRCYSSIYDTAIPGFREDLHHFRSSSLFVPISVSAIEGDREDLRRRLERLASDSSSIKELGDREDLRMRFEHPSSLSSSMKAFDHLLRIHEARKRCLAKHLLQKLSCTSQQCLSNSSDVCEAGLWKKEMEPLGTWGNSNFLGAGSGASGVCRTQWLGVPCARKEFHGQGSEVTFLKEASILSHLKHPHIVNFICCGNGEARGDRFIAMELMEKSLFDVIEERRGVHFALPVAVDIILQIAEGTRYLHDQGVAHRDLKPQNVLVNELAYPHLPDEYYCVKLVDFGMSKTKVEVSKSDTMSFRGIGTTRYRAPEVHPQAHVGSLGKAQWFRVDVYSFAMTCAHVLSLKAPFEDMEQLSELYARLLEGERPQLPSGLPRALVDIVEACWVVNPLWRPSFGNICTRLSSLRLDILEWNSMSDFYLTNRSGYSTKDWILKTIGEGIEMRPPRMSSPVATGQTSYYTAHSDFRAGDDTACEQSRGN